MPGHRNISLIKGWLFKMPMMLNCREFEDFILQYLEGDIPTYQKLKFEFHIKMCKECKDYLEVYRLAISSAKKAYQVEPEELPPIPEDLVTAILHATKEDTN